MWGKALISLRFSTISLPFDNLPCNIVVVAAAAVVLLSSYSYTNTHFSLLCFVEKERATTHSTVCKCMYLCVCVYVINENTFFVVQCGCIVSVCVSMCVCVCV